MNEYILGTAITVIVFILGLWLWRDLCKDYRHHGYLKGYSEITQRLTNEYIFFTSPTKPLECWQAMEKEVTDYIQNVVNLERNKKMRYKTVVWINDQHEGYVETFKNIIKMREERL